MRSTLGAPLPRRARRGDAGYDFFIPERTVLKKGSRPIVDTGIAMEDGDIPEGYFLLLVPKSSTGSNYGLSLANTCGVVDAGYRDTIKAKLWLNDPGMEQLILERHQKFMQGILIPHGVINGEIPPEQEREGGFGSTGRF